jgi:hypothetical protein
MQGVKRHGDHLQQAGARERLLKGDLDLAAAPIVVPQDVQKLLATASMHSPFSALDRHRTASSNTFITSSCDAGSCFPDRSMGSMTSWSLPSLTLGTTESNGTWCRIPVSSSIKR